MALNPSPRRILVIRSDRLGETVLNLPLIAALKQAFPQASVTWMVNPALVELLRDAPGAERVVPFPEAGTGAWWSMAMRLARRLRAERFDAAFVSNPRKDVHVATWLAGIPVRVGYERKWGWTLTHRIPVCRPKDLPAPTAVGAQAGGTGRPDEKAVGERHEVEYNLGLLDVVGGAVPSRPSLHLPVGDREAARLAQLLAQWQVKDADRVVAVHPWTSNPRKQWPVERFQMLIQRLGALTAGRVVVIGGQDERPFARALAVGSCGAIDLVGALSLRELAACLKQARVLVTNDSGPMHVAAAVGTPVVALFGTGEAGSHPARWGPWGSGHTVIHKPLEEISVDEVVSAVQRYVA